MHSSSQTHCELEWGKKSNEPDKRYDNDYAAAPNEGRLCGVNGLLLEKCKLLILSGLRVVKNKRKKTDTPEGNLSSLSLAHSSGKLSIN